VLLAGALAASGPAAFAGQPKHAVLPIHGVTIPLGYRKWEMVAPADEAAPLDELRVVLGNPAAIRAPFLPARDSISDATTTCSAKRAAPLATPLLPILSNIFDARHRTTVATPSPHESAHMARLCHCISRAAD